MQKIAILYSELAEYSLACFRALKETGTKLMVIHWPINPEAPFNIDLSFADESYSREGLTAADMHQKLVDFDPSLILVSGWMDKGYVQECKFWHAKISVVLTMDNHWFGTWRQRLATLVFPIMYRNVYNKAFVPGEVQRQYALRLGFRDSQIETGFYSADVGLFKQYAEKLLSAKQTTFPKRFLFLGRYVHHKGIYDMWNAFRRVRQDYPDWELWCVGTGDLYDERPEFDGLKHFGFVQPKDLFPLLLDTGVYILPSHFEPWGVSVHELAVAGFPMILSDQIGAKEAFLNEGANGFEFESGNEEMLETCMRRFASLSEEKLYEMAQESKKMGMSHTPEIWASTLISMID